MKIEKIKPIPKYILKLIAKADKTTYVPIDFTPFPIVTFVSPLQNLKASSPIDVTLSGIVMLVSELQALNACIPILVTLLGIVMLVNLLQ